MLLEISKKKKTVIFDVIFIDKKGTNRGTDRGTGNS